MTPLGSLAGAHPRKADGAERHQCCPAIVVHDASPSLLWLLLSRSRLSTFATCAAFHSPPRAVAIPRAVSAAATARKDSSAGRFDLPDDRHDVGGETIGGGGVGRVAELGGDGELGAAELLAIRLSRSERRLRPCEIIMRSCSATAARMCSVSRVACGLSTATNSTPESIRGR